MRSFLSIIFFCLLSLFYANGQEVDSGYSKVYEELDSMLNNKKPISFKQAVFSTENLYLGNTLSYSKFEEYIFKLTVLTKYWMQFNPVQKYGYPDSNNVLKNYAIFRLLKDTINLSIAQDGEYMHLPYTYDFNDFFGRTDRKNMFVTKLLAFHSGNCHSMPYLYKILADELGATCWLSLAPNHIYIKNRCKKIGWYNTELTSGEFPIDAWITTSGYIPIKAIQTGIYMDTLSSQQAIALCVLDLAKGYEFQSKNYYDGFILKCCDLVLQYHPVNVQAMLLKAETLKRIYEKQKKEKSETAISTYQQMEQLYIKLFDLGYREMPEKMYLEWLTSVTKQKEKYSNKQVNEVIKKK
jgi:hypothetical protein